MGELLGNKMAYSLDYAWPKSGGYVHPSDGVLVSMGGPAFSIVQSLIALLIIEKYRTLSAYPFAFFPMFSRYFSLVLGGSGSILAYNAAYEKRILKELSTDFPACGGWWKRIEPRIIDLMKPFRSFHYYHPRQEGSASIKSVLPALTGNGYEGMEIADGGTAALEYLRVTFGNVSRAERERVRKNLREYCSLDTRGMIEIVEALRDIVEKEHNG